MRLSFFSCPLKKCHALKVSITPSVVTEIRAKDEEEETKIMVDP